MTTPLTWNGAAVRKGLQSRRAVTIPARGRTMSNLAKVVIQLRRERDKAQKSLEQLDRALMALGGLSGLRKGASGAQKLRMKPRTMSAEARKRIAAAQRARWAKWKAKHKKPGTAA